MVVKMKSMQRVLEAREWWQVSGRWRMRASTHHQVEAGHGSVWGVRAAATSLRPDAASQALLSPTLPPTFQTSAAVMKLI